MVFKSRFAGLQGLFSSCFHSTLATYSTNETLLKIKTFAIFQNKYDKVKKITLFQRKCNKVKKVLNYYLSQGRLILTFFFFLMAVLGLHCCAWAFSSCSEWGLLLVAVHGLLIAVASPVGEHGL